MHFGVKKKITTDSNGVFAMIERNIYFKSRAVEENLIKTSRFITF